MLHPDGGGVGAPVGGGVEGRGGGGGGADGVTALAIPSDKGAPGVRPNLVS